MYTNLQNILIHSFICFHFKIKCKMRELSTIRHSVDLFWFRQWIGSTSSSIKINLKIKKLWNMEITESNTVITVNFTNYVGSLCNSTLCKRYLGVQKCKMWNVQCLKKIESSYRSLDLQIALVLWCATSGLKTEVIFSISIKNCICQWSLELYKGV